MPAQLVADGDITFIGGQDASKSPHDVPEGAYFTGINVSAEKGALRPRWGMQKHKLTFPAGGIEKANTTIKSFPDLFRTGKFQAIADYSIGTDYYIVIVISGQIFFVNEKTLAIQHIPLEGEQMNPRSPRINWSPAGKYLVFYDYPAFPVIIEGSTARRADPDKDEIPVSNIGGYNQNRLIVGNAGNEFTAGDPVGNTATPDAPISFLEFFTPSTTAFLQVFQLSTNYNNDPITAIGFLQVADTSTGIGPLLVATKNAIYSYQTQLPRDQWTAGQFGSILVYNAGIVGPRAITNLNSDVIFYSADGEARSLSMSREEQGKWSKTPISREVQNWLKVHDPSLLQYSFISYFKNKVFLSANPYRTSAIGINGEHLPDYANGGFVVLEFDNISTLTKESPPVWAGLWTGCRPMDMVVCNERAFVMSKDEDGINELYELRPDITYDTDGENIRYIKSKIETRDYDFKSPFNDKKLHSIDFTLEDIKGDFKLDVRYRPSQVERYTHWRTFTHAAPWRFCRAPYVGLNGLAGHSFLNINLGTPLTIGCDKVTGEYLGTFRNVQFEISLEGIYWELRGHRIKAILEPQNENITSCGIPNNVPLPLECNTDWKIEDFEICQQKQT